MKQIRITTEGSTTTIHLNKQTPEPRTLIVRNDVTGEEVTLSWIN